MLQPQLLADGQHVPVVLESRHRTAKRTTDANRRLLRGADRLFERIALDVLHQREVERRERQDPAFWAGLRHGVVHLPVLVAYRRRRRAREIEEVVARRLGRLAFEVVTLVDAIERGFDDARILATFDLLL